LINAAACGAALAALPASVAQAASTGGALWTSVPSATAGAVHLIATPAHPVLSAPVHLLVGAPGPGATGFAWDLSGHGAFTRHTAAAQTVVRFATPGTHTVAVRFDVQGHTELAVATLTVAPSRPPAQPQQAPSQRAQQAQQVKRRTRSPEQTHASRATQRAADHATAHAAGDPGVAIADFHFTPGTTTIHVGVTVTWSNSGPSSHTATATNGSFNTGILKKGQSASHTFTQAGTFAYACQIHPFMHGTIVVLASTTSTTQATTTPTTSTTPASTTPTPTSSTAAADTGPSLPNTGFNVLEGLLAGLALLALGTALRRTRSQPPRRHP
jgi:plastocyanin